VDRRTFLGTLPASVGALAEPASAQPCPPDIWLHHRPPRDYLAAAGRTKGVAANDTALVARLLKSYRRFFKQHHYAGGMWELFFRERHGALHDVFMKGSVEEAAKILRNPSGSDLHYGFDETRVETAKRLEADGAARAQYASRVKMFLVTVAEALGAAKVESSESDKRYPVPPTERLLRAIDKPMGIPIAFPNPFPDEFGLQTDRGVAGERSVQALYQAFRTRALVAGMRHPKILEIGAGTGRAAYYCHRMGLTDYTILDLPFTGISQGYFLGRTLGESAVALEGEPARREALKLISPDPFLADTTRYDLVVNVDGLTEMPLSVSRGYWKAIKARARLFLSINHEVNEHSVMEITETSPITRHPYWMRRGYVEELYAIS
jgi:hypothetical protein